MTTTIFDECEQCGLVMPANYDDHNCVSAVQQAMHRSINPRMEYRVAAQVAQSLGYYVILQPTAHEKWETLLSKRDHVTEVRNGKFTIDHVLSSMVLHRTSGERMWYPMRSKSEYGEMSWMVSRSREDAVLAHMYITRVQHTDMVATDTRRFLPEYDHSKMHALEKQFVTRLIDYRARTTPLDLPADPRDDPAFDLWDIEL